MQLVQPELLGKLDLKDLKVKLDLLDQQGLQEQPELLGKQDLLEQMLNL